MSDVFISIRIEELQSFISQAVQEGLSKIVDQQRYEPLIKADEAAEVLKVSKPTLAAWRDKGYIPCHRINSRVYYKRSELMQALEQLPTRKGRRK